MDNTIRTISCMECGGNFETDMAGFIRHCDPCTETLNARAEQQQRLHREAEHKRKLAALEEEISEQTPPRFRTTDIKHPSFNRKAWAKIESWKPTDEKPWLFLVGSTGACKTRMAYMLARQYLISEANKGHRASYLLGSSTDLSLAALDQFSKERGKGAKKLLSRHHHDDFVLIDDLGKGRLTPGVAAEVYAIVNYRHENNLPTIFTANSMPEDIAQSMTLDMAAPFAGRLNECSTIYNLG